MSAGVCAVIGLSSAPAGAVNNNPAGNPSSPAVSYESDCTTALQAGAVAPFITSTVINTTTDNAKPIGASFGVAGSVSETVPGYVLAAYEQVFVFSTLGFNVNETFGSTDGNATGSYNYTKSFTGQPNPGGHITGVNFSSGSTTLSGDFTGVPLGAFLSNGSTGAIPNGSFATSAGTATGITINAATTGAGAGVAVGWASPTGFTVTDNSFASPANAFTTAAATPTAATAGIGLTSTTEFDVVIPSILNVVFGGAPGVGSSNCLETGWVNGTTSGPNQPPLPVAMLPSGSTTALIAATPVFQPGAFVNLVDTAPTPQNQTVSIGMGTTGSVTLTASAGSYPGPFTFSLASTSPQGHLTFSQASAGSATVNLSNNATGAETDTFNFNACDIPPSPLTPVCSSTPATITVVIGTPPVTQPLEQTVVGGLLELSCNSPANYVPGNNPLATCPEFSFPSITLNGLEQTVQATTGNTGGTPSASAPGTIFISDNRGSSTGTWSLVGTFIKSDATDTNAACNGIVAFCNQDTGPGTANNGHALVGGGHNGEIDPSYLSVGNIACTSDAVGGINGNPPNLNPAPTAGLGDNFGDTVHGVTLCTTASGLSGGTFLYNAQYTLTIPESVYAGHYIGTVQYTVS